MTGVLQNGWREYESGRYAKALDAARAVLTLRPDAPAALALKAMSEMWLGGDVAAATRQLKKALKLAPDMPLLHHNLGTLFAFAGDMAAAEQSFERALALDPENIGTFYNLALVRKHDRFDALAARMSAVADKAGLQPARAGPLHFGLAKIYADLKQYEPAITHVLKANALATGHYNPADSDRHLDSLKKLRRTEGFSALPDSGIGSAKPLFIVGMPRSGTSLVEGIFGRHSKVRPCGELPDILDIERALTAEMSARAGRSVTALQALVMAEPSDLKAHGEAMLKKVQARGRGPYKIFTDKMPPNGLRLGLIARLFPQARVIVMQRDLRDCCLSNLFARLPSTYAYTQRMDWLGHYARYFQAAVAEWRQMVDLDICDVRYEELTRNPEPAVRAILDFAGLEFEAVCLHPERGDASIKTASVLQARQAINAGSVGRWRNYEPWLGPLLASLDENQRTAD